MAADIAPDVVAELRKRAAAADLRRAHKYGAVMIGKTVRGTVEVTCLEQGKSAAGSRFRIATQDGGSWVVEGAYRDVGKQLAELYVVEVES